MDNLSGKIGGDSNLSLTGLRYASDLTIFINAQRQEWDIRQADRARQTHFPPLPGDASPPNPAYNITSTTTTKDASSPSSPSSPADINPSKSFCVWTSMLRRSIQTAQFFDEDEYDIKQMRMLDELNAGAFEGCTYDDIRRSNPEEYKLRQADKLHYRYPGAGGEGYLDVINRLRAVIVEVERMTDHVLLVGHRSIARVLLAYFMGLGRGDVADLDCPLGMLYCLEPKPYGVDFKAYRWMGGTAGGTGGAEGDGDGGKRALFEVVPGYELRRSEVQTVC